MRLKNIFTIPLALLFFSGLFAQSGVTVSGVIKDRNSKLILPFVNVVLKAEKESIRRSLVLDHEEAILAQLQHEALTAKTDGARIRALELLGRHAGMFTERVEVEQVERSVSQIEADIRQRLERLGIT